MKSLLVVEDDRMVRQEICSIVRQCGVPVDIVLECSNGESAWDIIQENQIDVVFTDINMPRMDGFRLTEQLKKMKRPPMIVAISGDNDFSSAVRMLRNGAREYILKPVDPLAVQHIMQELNTEIEERERKEYTERRICEQWIRNFMLYDAPAPDKLRLLEEKYEDYFFPDQYRVCACEKDCVSVSSASRVMVLNDVDEGQICLVSEEHLKPFLNKELPEKAVGISLTHRGLGVLRNAYVEVQEARRRAFCIDQVVRYGEKHASGGVVPRKLKEQAATLLEEKAKVKYIQLIGTDKTEEMVKQWSVLFDAVKKERIAPNDFIEEMKSLILEIGKIYRSMITEADQQKMKELEQILSFDCLAEYEKRFLNWLTELNARMIEEKEGGQNRHKIRMALEYIEQNYNRDLNMAVVSNYISMNYSLFSLLFKQYTGTKFVDYLKDIRIKEAKRLLVDTDMKVAEISQAIGYDNEKNFMKVFKAVCGVSPTEYRKNMR